MLVHLSLKKLHLMKKYKYLLFDLDNTLLDFTRSSESSFKKMIGHYSDLDKETLFKEYYIINKACWSAAERGELALSEIKTLRFQRFNALFEIDADPNEMNTHYFDYLRESVFYVNDALDVLKQIRAKQIGMSIITNGLKEVQDRRIELSGIKDYFDAIIISDAIGVKKPDTAFFDYTLKQIPSFNKEDLLVIGDTAGSDILGAYNANIPSCWFNPNQKEWSSNKFKPTHSISQLPELLELI